jgi:hypothetical protein
MVDQARTRGFRFAKPDVHGRSLAVQTGRVRIEVIWQPIKQTQVICC